MRESRSATGGPRWAIPFRLPRQKNSGSTSWTPRRARINTQAGDYYHASAGADGQWPLPCIHLEDRPVRFGVGDWIVARYGDPPNKVFLADCRGCTVKDVTLMRNGFAPIFESEGGGNHVLRCHWALGPRPSGATEDPVVTNAADGIHSPDADPGPDIEGCTFDGVFLDDCIAIHGGFHKIVSVHGPTLVAQNAYAFYAVGEPVRHLKRQGLLPTGERLGPQRQRRRALPRSRWTRRRPSLWTPG